jgi:hypothetical protein
MITGAWTTPVPAPGIPVPGRRVAAAPGNGEQNAQNRR